MTNKFYSVPIEIKLTHFTIKLFDYDLRTIVLLRIGVLIMMDPFIIQMVAVSLTEDSIELFRCHLAIPPPSFFLLL